MTNIERLASTIERLQLIAGDIHGSSYASLYAEIRELKSIFVDLEAREDRPPVRRPRGKR